MAKRDSTAAVMDSAPGATEAPAPTARSGRSSVETAIALFDERANSQREAREAARATAMGKYLRILRRAEQPDECDASDLLALMDELALSPEQVGADFKLVRRAAELSDSLGDREQLHADVSSAQAALREWRINDPERGDIHSSNPTVARAAREHDQQLVRNQMQAQERADREYGAPRRELQELRASRPEFFCNGDPPQLLD